MSYLRTEKWPNGDIFSYVNFYTCNHCKSEICDKHPHMAVEDKHYCWDCSFIVGVIDEKYFLRHSPLGGIANIRAAVRNNEVVYWSTKKPPWEMPDKEYRKTKAYREWRQNVLGRDDHTCQHCGSKEKLEAHHIKSFSKYEKQRYKVTNGLTLCQSCHRKVHSKRMSG